MCDDARNLSPLPTSHGFVGEIRPKKLTIAGNRADSHGDSDKMIMILSETFCPSS
jgi:hypothetical protein